MYNKTDKRRLYWLLNQYLSNSINEIIFTDEFHDSFVNKIDSKCFSENEYLLFSELNKVASKFSPYESDHALWAGFTSAETLKTKIEETAKQLKRLGLYEFNA